MNDTHRAASPAPDFHAGILDRLRKLCDDAVPPRQAIENILRLAAKHRALLLQNTIIANCGTTVLGGPFAGMTFVRDVAEGCYVPKLLGCYEQELHAEVERIVKGGYTRILNIGCAEGYYAVGLARRMPNTTVLAFDIDPNAQKTCRALADKNGVGHRVQVSGLFRGEDFARYTDGRTLVVCDIEGAELGLLDPERSPALRGFDLVVEMHDSMNPAISTTIATRFESSHDLTYVKHSGRTVTLPPFFDKLGHLDQLLAVWEWRTGPTPWALLRVKATERPGANG